MIPEGGQECPLRGWMVRMCLSQERNAVSVRKLEVREYKCNIDLLIPEAIQHGGGEMRRRGYQHAIVGTETSVEVSAKPSRLCVIGDDREHDGWPGYARN